MTNIIEKNLYEIIKKKLEDRIKLKTEYVVKGASEDYANYRERVGELNELQFLLVELEHTVKAFDPY